MKLRIAKGCIVIMPMIGTLGLFIFTFVGKIIYGWGLFVLNILAPADDEVLSTM